MSQNTFGVLNGKNYQDTIALRPHLRYNTIESFTIKWASVTSLKICNSRFAPGATLKLSFLSSYGRR